MRAHRPAAVGRGHRSGRIPWSRQSDRGNHFCAASTSPATPTVRVGSITGGVERRVVGRLLRNGDGHVVRAPHGGERGRFGPTQQPEHPRGSAAGSEQANVFAASDQPRVDDPVRTHHRLEPGTGTRTGFAGFTRPAGAAGTREAAGADSPVAATAGSPAVGVGRTPEARVGKRRRRHRGGAAARTRGLARRRRQSPSDPFVAPADPEGKWRPSRWCATGPVTGSASCRAATA